MISKNENTDQLLSSLNSEDFQDRFNRSPFRISHNLSTHPLFLLESLIDLSKELPDDLVEYNSGDIPVTQDPNSTPKNGLSIQETISRIRNNKSWLVLKNVENHPSYQQLLHQCLEEMEDYCKLSTSGMTHKQGFIFISSPGSMTPFHIDPENNFLLQIQGSKEVWMFDREDRHVIQEKQIEDFFSGAHRNLEFKESYRERGEKFMLEPGQGLHFPVAAPHYVQNGPDVSVSFSITFQTKQSSERQTLHRFNKTLRRFGLTPSEVNSNPWRDQSKLTFLRVLKRVKSLGGKES